MKLSKLALCSSVALFLILSPWLIALGQPPPDFVKPYLVHPAVHSFQMNEDGSATVFFKTSNADDVDWDGADLIEKEVFTGDYIHNGYITKGLAKDSHVVHLRSMLPLNIESNYSHNIQDDHLLIGNQWFYYYNNELPYVISDTSWGLVKEDYVPAKVPENLLNHKALQDIKVAEDSSTTLYFKTCDKGLVDFDSKTLSSTFVPTGNTYFAGYTTTGQRSTDQYTVPFSSQLPNDIGNNFTRYLLRDSVTGLPVTVSGDYLMDNFNNNVAYSTQGLEWGLVYVSTKESFLPGDVDPFNNGNGTASYIANFASPAGFRNISTSTLNAMAVGSSTTYNGTIANYNAWVSSPAYRIPTEGNTGIVYMTVTRTSSTNFTWSKYIVETVSVFNLELFSYSRKYEDEQKELWSWQETLQAEPSFSLENFSYSDVYDEVTVTEWSWSITVEPADEPYIPEGEPDPKPDPIPDPEPDPILTPDPTPNPDPQPDPEPNPAPDPDPEPDPKDGPLFEEGGSD
ncbi:MAG: hypothetical protein FWC99_07035, partial [Coriobacteriia bacterium]|nr:hypothetical protein [Coriobacteriia bacterium]